MRISVIIAALLLATPAAAHWKASYADSPNASWFKAQRDCNGTDCCGKADAEPYWGGYDSNADGSVTLENGIKIKKCQVLEGPNKMGHAILWRSGETIYCFSRGPEF